MFMSLYSEVSRSIESVKHVFRRCYWTREAVSLLLSVVAISVLCGVLQMHNHQPYWQGSITLNAVVSIIITLLYAFLSLPIRNSLCQLRWLHFRSLRRAVDFQTFDGAIGGVGNLASLKVLASRKSGFVMHVKYRKLESIMTLSRILSQFAVLLSFAVFSIGPFSQQILQFETAQLAIEGNASLPVADFDPASLRVGEMSVLNTTIVQAVVMGLFKEPDEVLAITPVCSGVSANLSCSWHDFATIEVQSSCRDISDQLLLANQSIVSVALDNFTALAASTTETLPPLITLPSGLQVHLDKVVQLLPWGASAGLEAMVGYTKDEREYPLNFTFVDTDASLSTYPACSSNNTSAEDVSQFSNLRVQLVSAQGNVTNDTENSTPQLQYSKLEGWDCNFSLVLQPQEATYSGKTLVEQPIASPIPAKNCTCTANDQSMVCYLAYLWNGREYRMESSFMADLQEIFAYALTASSAVTWTWNGTTPNYTVMSSRPSSPTANMIYGLMAGNAGIGTNASIMSPPTFMSNVAKSMSKTFRTLHPKQISGKTFVVKTVYRVSWPWLSLPLALIIATAMLVAATACLTHRKGVPVWTDSVLAVMVHGIDNRTRSRLMQVHDADDLEEVCERVKVELEGDDFVLRRRGGEKADDLLDGSGWI